MEVYPYTLTFSTVILMRKGNDFWDFFNIFMDQEALNEIHSKRKEFTPKGAISFFFFFFLFYDVISMEKGSKA